MAASLTSVRTGIAANLAALGKSQGIQVSAYVLSNPTLPTIWVRPDAAELITYHQAMQNGLEHWHLVVEAFVGTGTDIGAQVKLDGLVASTGASSVKAAIESDKTLGGVAQSLMVGDAHGYAEYARPDGSTVLGAKWQITVEMNGG